MEQSTIKCDIIVKFESFENCRPIVYAMLQSWLTLNWLIVHIHQSCSFTVYYTCPWSFLTRLRHVNLDRFYYYYYWLIDCPWYFIPKGEDNEIICSSRTVEWSKNWAGAGWVPEWIAETDRVEALNRNRQMYRSSETRERRWANEERRSRPA